MKILFSARPIGSASPDREPPRSQGTPDPSLDTFQPNPARPQFGDMSENHEEPVDLGDFMSYVNHINEDDFPKHEVDAVYETLMEMMDARQLSKDAYLLDMLIQQLDQVARKRPNALAEELVSQLDALRENNPDATFKSAEQLIGDLMQERLDEGYAEGASSEDKMQASIENQDVERVCNSVFDLGHKYASKHDLLFDFALWNPMVHLARSQGEGSYAAEVLNRLEKFRDRLWQRKISGWHQDMLRVNRETGLYDRIEGREGLEETFAAFDLLRRPEARSRAALMDFMRDHVTPMGNSYELIRQVTRIMLETPESGIRKEAIRTLWKMRNRGVGIVDRHLKQYGFERIDAFIAQDPTMKERLDKKPILASLFRDELDSPSSYLAMAAQSDDFDQTQQLNKLIRELLASENQDALLMKTVLATAKDSDRGLMLGQDDSRAVKNRLPYELDKLWEQYEAGDRNAGKDFLKTDLITATARLATCNQYINPHFLEKLGNVAREPSESREDRLRAFEAVADEIERYAPGEHPEDYAIYLSARKALLDNDDPDLVLRAVAIVYLAVYTQALDDERQQPYLHDENRVLIKNENQVPTETVLAEFLQDLIPYKQKLAAMLSGYEQKHPIPENARNLSPEQIAVLRTLKVLKALNASV